MKKRNLYRALALLLTVACCCSIFPTAAFAANSGEMTPNASNYISSYGGRVCCVDGKLQVEFSITGTGTMSTIGATKIVVKRTADDNTMKTFYVSSTPSMMGSNTNYYSSSVSFITTLGVEYYAIITFKAGNSSGSDTRTYTTSSVRLLV